MSFIKKLVLALAFTLGLVATGQAETIKVFAHNLGQITGMSDATKAGIASMLNDATKDVDFGYFCGPKGSSYFTVSDDNYIFDSKLVVQAYGGIHVITYRSDRYELLKRYDYVSLGNGGVDAGVLQNKETKATYALIMPTGVQFNTSASGKINAYCKGIADVIASCRKDYPDVKIFVGTTVQWGVTYDELQKYLTLDTYLGLVETRPTETAGGIYYEADDTISMVMAENITVSSISEPAVVATITYAQQYTVIFNNFDGSELKREMVLQGNDATPPSVPDREGYDFTGWDGSYENIQADTVLTAQYEIKTFTVTFKDWDGTILKSQEVEYGQDATPPSEPTRDGYRFLAWQGNYTNVKANSEVTATYVEATAKTYVITFVDFDGNVLKDEEVVEGDSATPPDVPEREGYDFVGWSGEYQNVHATATITPTYTIKKFAVTFKDINGDIIETQMVEWRASATPPTPPTVAGHTFAAWQGNWENVEQAEEVVATYTINSYTVKFLGEDDDLLSEQLVEYQQPAVAPDDPESKNPSLVFDCWDTDFSCITADLTVKAVFMEGNFSVGTAQELVEKMAVLAAKSKVTVTLTADLDFTDVEFTPLDLLGTLDGQGYSITGLANDAMLFDKLYGTVKNLKVCNIGDGTRIDSSVGFGVFACSAYGAVIDSCTIENCNRYFKVTGGKIGAFVSETDQDADGNMTIITNCVVKNCRLTAMASGTPLLGGIVGQAQFTRIVDCKVLQEDQGKVEIGSGAARTGGILGFANTGVSDVYVERCLVEGRVFSNVATENIGGTGGIIGTAESGNSGTKICYILDCTNRAEIVGAYHSGNGGILGRTFKSPLVIGRCVNYATVTSSEEKTTGSQSGTGAGGLVGGLYEKATDTSVIYDSANFGAVSAGQSDRPAGGLVATITAGGTVSAIVVVSNCMNYASVCSTNAAGGIVGLYYGPACSLSNVGNNGAISTTEGAAGGICGKCNVVTAKDAIVLDGAMQAGVVSCTTGFAGLCLGEITGTKSCTITLKRAILAGSATATDGGAVAAVCANNAAGDLAKITADENCRTVMASADPVIALMNPQDVNSSAIRKVLNNNAIAKGYMSWVRGKNCPELSLFGKEVKPGIVLMIW